MNYRRSDDWIALITKLLFRSKPYVRISLPLVSVGTVLLGGRPVFELIMDNTVCREISCNWPALDRIALALGLGLVLLGVSIFMFFALRDKGSVHSLADQAIGSYFAKREFSDEVGAWLRSLPSYDYDEFFRIVASSVNEEIKRKEFFRWREKL